MLETVDLGWSSSADYRGLAPDGILDELERIGSELRGLRVLHVNATPYGGGVSELLRSTVPVLNDIGLVAEWRVIGGDDRLFRATKRIHNGLQGASGGLSGEDRAVYEAAARRNAGDMAEEYDVVFVHDPQPAAIPALRAGARHAGSGAAISTPQLPIPRCGTSCARSSSPTTRPSSRWRSSFPATCRPPGWW